MNIKMVAKNKNDDNEKYFISCVICGRKDNLVVYPHRNKKYESIAGLLFCCLECEDKIKQMVLCTEEEI